MNRRSKEGLPESQAQEVSWNLNTEKRPDILHDDMEKISSWVDSQLSFLPEEARRELLKNIEQLREETKKD